MMKTMAQIKAEETRNKERINHCAGCTLSENSGVYILTREDDGFRFAYVGQAVRVLTRLAQHLAGYVQHIDLSLRKHGLYSETNPSGWRISVRYCDEICGYNLDELECEYIRQCAEDGYQLLNKTTGSQSAGKRGIAENKSSKGYRDGVANGYEKARKEVARLFELHLDATTKKDGNKNQEKALAKFNAFLEGGENNG